jgi:DNA-directed RNA polymerase specialized sigma subunit
LLWVRIDDLQDPHFDKFATSLERMLAAYAINPRQRFEHQKSQMESLVAAEKAFRLNLVRHRFGEKVYKAFLSYIHEERRNVLAARPFFRERAEVFKASISPQLAARSHKGLYKFAINGQFVQFVFTRFGYLFKGKSPVRVQANEVLRLRKELVEQNLPLAISRAKLFRRKTPASPHMANMDAVQTAGEGLISAVDKYVLPFAGNFRAVIIGRATGNLISTYSEPMLHFYPGDRRKIYRANKARRRTQEVDKIVESVNDGLPEAMKTNADEIQMLMNASSHLSLDQPVTTPDGQNEKASYADCTADQNMLPSDIVEQKESQERLAKGLASLSLMERKALALKGFVSEV